MESQSFGAPCFKPLKLCRRIPPEITSEFSISRVHIGSTHVAPSHLSDSLSLAFVGGTHGIAAFT